MYILIISTFIGSVQVCLVSCETREFAPLRRPGIPRSAPSEHSTEGTAAFLVGDFAIADSGGLVVSGV